MEPATLTQMSSLVSCIVDTAGPISICLYGQQVIVLAGTAWHTLGQ